MYCSALKYMYMKLGYIRDDVNIDEKQESK